MNVKPGHQFLGSKALGELLAHIGPIACLDIGARGGPKEDLLAIAPAANVYCFEPDADECTRLNHRFSRGTTPFNEVRFFPVALSKTGGKRMLHITRHAGASSLLAPLPEVGSGFSRPQYVEVVRTVEIDTLPLDSFASQSGLPDISHIKIDVEGLELEILQSAAQMLAGSVVAIRTEVAFLALRAGQPLYCDTANFLKCFDFIPMGFAELHHWRRYSSNKHLKLTDDPIPFSRGQLAHGDMIFFRDPDKLPAVTETDLRNLVKAAFLSLSYGFVDHASYLLKRPELAALLKLYQVAPDVELRTVALELARKGHYIGVGSLLRRRKGN